jgi:hypothetical protein
MRDSIFNKILSFLHGASIAFVMLGSFLTFTFFLSFGLAQALSSSFIFIFVALVIILWIDSFATKHATLEEMKKQTEILQRLEKNLNDQKLLDN